MRTLLSCLALAALVAAPATSQSIPDRAPERELIVEFVPGIIELPDVRATALPSALTVRTPAVLTALVAHRAEALARAFPDFRQSDTLGVSRTGRPLRRPDVSGVYVVRFPSHADVRAAAAVLSALPSVVFAEPNGGSVSQVARPASSVFLGPGLARMGGPLAAFVFNPVHPNDPYYDDPYQSGIGGVQWNLLNTGQNGGTVDADIDAPEAWTSSVGEPDSKLAIIDGGTQSTHEDLSGKVSGNGTNADNHGTHVAGIAAARGNNALGIAGVSWNSPLFVKNSGSSDTDLYNAIMDAVWSTTWAMNNSYILCESGTCGNSTPTPRYSTLVRRAFAAAYRENMSSIAATGNYNTSNVYYPAGFGQGVIAVGATNRNDLRWTWNSTQGSNTGAHLDLVAPGEDILSSVPYQTALYGPYDVYTGTSMAAPHVTGAIGLLLGRRTDLYHDDHENLLRLSAEKVRPVDYPYDAQGFNPNMGYGRLNVRRLLDRLEAPYILTHIQTSGGSVHSVSGSYGMTIYDAPGLASSGYIVKRHEVRKAVTFPQAMQEAHVWGLGHPTVGWADNGNANFAMGYAAPVPGTVTGTGAVLRTYVYEVSTIWGQFVGWYPTTPANVQMWYTLHGIPAPPPGPLAVSISGPSSLGWKQTGTWTAQPTGGTGSYTYAWYERYPGGTWSGPVSTTASYSRIMISDDFELRVDVTSGAQSASATRYVAYDNCTGPNCAQRNPVDGATLAPASYALHGARPNPVAGATTLRYDLPEVARVRLAVYDALGREVARLVDGEVSAGAHSARLDGAWLPAGVYVVRMEADGASGPYRATSRLTLAR